MKTNKLITLLAAAIAVVACDKDADKLTVSFETALPITSDGAATLTLSVKNYDAAMGELTIPVEFTSADAVEGTDYEVSAKQFVYGSAKDVTTITVTPLVYGSNKKLTATMGIPNGCSAGKYTTTTFTLSDKIAYVSFESSKAFLMDKAKIRVDLYDGNNSTKKLEKGDRIPVTINTEKTTAVEGTNFKFGDAGKFAVIDAGENKGAIDIEIVGEAEEGKDLIVLNFNLGTKYSEGQILEVAISILGSGFDKMGGTWVANQLVTDTEYMSGEYMWQYFWTEESTKIWPAFNAEDSFTIDTDAATFTPDFKSNLKEYFIGVSNISKDAAYILNLGISDKRNMQLFEFDNINRYMIATNASQDKKALVGIRFITDETTSEELLDMYIIDHECPIFEDFTGMLDSTKPVATMSGCFVNITFKKKAN